MSSSNDVQGLQPDDHADDQPTASYNDAQRLKLDDHTEHQTTASSNDVQGPRSATR